MAVAVVDSTSIALAQNTSVPKPTTTGANYVVLITAGRGSTSPTADPTGFSPPLVNVSGGGSASFPRVIVWGKVLDGTEGATFDLAFSANPFGDAFAVTLSGVDEEDPFNISSFTSDVDLGATLTCPTATTTVDACHLIHVAAMARSGGFAADTWAATGGGELEDPGNSGTGTRIGAAISAQAGPVTAGATATKAWTVTAADFGNAIGVSLAFAPVHGEDPPDPPGEEVEGSTLGDLYMPWRDLNDLLTWEEYVDTICDAANTDNFADAHYLFWQEQSAEVD